MSRLFGGVSAPSTLGSFLLFDVPGIAGVDARVQYGPRITAIVVYLYVGQFLSKQRTAQALADLFGTPMSAGTVATMTRRGADGLAGFLDEVRARLVDADVVGFDETGF